MTPHLFSKVIFPNIACLLSLAAAASLWAQSPRRQPLPAADSIAQLVVEPGFRVDLLASEPNVIDPVEVAFDDAGRMWVVEMRDYPLPSSGTPQGAIRILEDTDGDGALDTAHRFASELDMPTGLALWRDGAVVTVAGKLLFLRDRDGDSIADEEQEWLDGFALQNEQLRANHPRLGIDGKWYIASGLRGGNVRVGAHFRSDNDTQEWNIGSRDVRFDAANGKVDLITGPAQFGLCFDLFGQRFFCSNRNPAVQVVFEQEDLEGNPLAGIAAPVRDVVPAGENSRVHPIVEAWTTSNLHAGQYTAACGVFLQPQLVEAPNGGRGSPLCVCEPTGSLVNRYIAVRDGYRYSVQQSEWSDEHAWIASHDPWFRPVNVNLAPDGQLIIVDMHRAVIEHPQWVPEELKHRPDERWGNSAGRIYWAGPEEQPALTGLLAELRRRPLRNRSDGELLSLVADSGAWLRETASRLLLERSLDGGLNSEAALQLMKQAKSADLPLVGRIRSLQLAWLLDANLLNDVLEIAGSDGYPSELSRVALRCLRSAEGMSDALIQVATSRMNADDDALRFDAMLTMGVTRQERSGSQAAQAPLRQDVDAVIGSLNSGTPLNKALQPPFRVDDPYWLIANGSAMREDPSSLLSSWMLALVENGRKQKAAVGSAQEELIVRVTETITRAAKRSVGDESAQYVVGLKIAKRIMAEESLGDMPLLAALVVLREASQIASLQAELDGAVWEIALRIAKDPQATSAVRHQAIRLLSRSPRDSDGRFIAEAARNEADPATAAALLEAWAALGDEACDAFLIDSLATSSPRQQATLLRLVAARSGRLQLLIDELESERLSPRQVGAAGLKQLVSAAKGQQKTKLQQILDGSVDSDRAAILARYKSCLELESDPTRGKLMFEKHCAACHRIGEIGQQVGPDISDSRSKTPIELLTSIIDPNRVIDNNYFRYIFLTQEGAVVEGMIIDETSEAITIRNQETARHTLLREDIVEVKATGTSLMPDGLEAQVDPQAMADMIAYIKGWRYMDGAIPSN